MKLGKLYRDIVSALDAPEDQVRKLDVTNLINQTISEIRTELVQKGLGKEFLYTETIWATVEDVMEFPFINKATLDKILMRGLPIQWTVQQSVFWETENELQDVSQSWSEGDLAIKGKYVYEALDDITSTNTYELTFEVDNIRNYYDNNGLKFNVGDIVRNQSDDTFWRCTSAYTNNQGETISASGSFEQLLWKRIGKAYQEGTPVKFDELFQTNLESVIDDHFPFTIKEDKFYTSVDKTPITVSYIPEWDYVEDLSSDLDIPDMIVQTIRNRTIRLLASKLGIKAENLPDAEGN